MRYRYLSAILLIGIGLRLLHLLDGSHYFILGADSYYFHHLSKEILAGADVPGARSGLAYPISWLGSGDLAMISIPILIYIVGSLALYITITKLLSPGDALAALISYSVMPLSILTTASGYVDRDGLTILLIALSVLVWLILRNRPIMSSIWLLAIIEITVFYWSSLARWIMIVMLFVIITTMWALELRGSAGPRSRRRYLIPIISLGLSAVIGLVLGNQAILPIAAGTVTNSMSGESPITELIPATPAHLLVMFSFILLFAIVGFLLLISRKRALDWVMLVWLCGSLAAGIAVQRILILAIPPMIIVAGIGIVEIISRAREIIDDTNKRKAQGIAIILIMIITASISYQSYGLGAVDRMAPDLDWQASLDYLQKNTDSGARILSHWGYGYWILGLAERDPCIAGRPGYIEEMDLICKTNSPAIIQTVLSDCNADYLIIDDKRIEGGWLNFTTDIIRFGHIVIIERNAT